MCDRQQQGRYATGQDDHLNVPNGPASSGDGAGVEKWGCSGMPVVGEDGMVDEAGEPLGVMLFAPAVIEEEPARLW